ncbi:MAG: polysaccharide deacetylase family protein [Chitinophagaceae bacterium]
MYFVKPPALLKRLFPADLTWKKESHDTVYLSFDDGPHPVATPFVLDQLDAFHAKATFFCIGKNVSLHPDIYHRILVGEHSVGNHTQNHLNGWKTSTDIYLKNVRSATSTIDSTLFRPPYGKIKKAQAAAIQKQGYEIVMWDILCGDFDTDLSPEQCWQNIRRHIRPGAIVVFHDSAKAWERMRYALPLTLDYCRSQNWKFGTL